MGNLLNQFNWTKNSPSENFAAGNYTAVILNCADDDWRKYAALGLIGKTQEALEGLNRLEGDEVRFYQAVTHWIGGCDSKSIDLIEKIPLPYAQNLLSLIKKEKISVLAQLPWNRSGCWDLLTAAANDEKFSIKNISFDSNDLSNRPYSDIHEYYNNVSPPDFYICQMAEWHLIPPNIQELACPIFAQTADYDLHIQAVHPWLQLFDQVVVTDHTEWQDVHKLVSVPVSTFPKSFCLPKNLPGLSKEPREVDLFLSGTVTHPYHPDKAQLLSQLLEISNLNIKIVNGFDGIETYYKNLSESKVCFTYVRHSGATPTRGLEALGLGCAVVVQEGCVLTLFVGEDEGVLTYNASDPASLIAGLKTIVQRWPEYREKAHRGGQIIRREFAATKVASQYLRFLTFLAAKPNLTGHRKASRNLIQKRVVLQKGWLPSYDFTESPVLKEMCVKSQERLQSSLESKQASSRTYIDWVREVVLANYHRSLTGPIGKQHLWLTSVIKVCNEGIAKFPNSLVLRFNLIRVVLHFGAPKEVSKVLRLLDKTIQQYTTSWEISPLDDVFPWDFCPTYFNYRRYFDLSTQCFTLDKPLEPELVKLILASLNYYKALYSNQNSYFRKAIKYDPNFPYFKYTYAKFLMEKKKNVTALEKARKLLLELSDGSTLFLNTLDLMQDEKFKVLAPLSNQGKENSNFEKIRQNLKSIENFPDAPLKLCQEDIFSPLRNISLKKKMISQVFQSSRFLVMSKAKFIFNILFNAYEEDIVPFPVEKATTRAILFARIQSMKTSKFWKLRNFWLRIRASEGEITSLTLDQRTTREELSAQIQFMEENTFWKLRTAWFKLKWAFKNKLKKMLGKN